jgi:mono/diheme cytochrome c family protein
VYPPLAGSEWVKGDPAVLVKIVLHGLEGPVRVAGKDYGGVGAVGMPAMGGLTDEQVADVLTHVRAEFGEGAGAVNPALVRRVRAETADRTAAWTAKELGR